MSEPSVTLRDYLDVRISAVETLARTWVDGHAAVHAVADDTNNRRLDAMNALRSQIESERGMYVTRESLDDIVKVITAELREVARTNQVRIAVLEGGYANFQGRLWALGAGLTTTIAVVALAMKFL